MRTSVSLLLAFAIVAAVAGSSLSAPAASGARKPAKCVKWGKKNGKRVCVRRAKPKPKVQPKPAPAPSDDGDTTTAPDPGAPPAGHYRANTSQGTVVQFDLVNDNLGSFTINELDATCNPGSWLTGIHLSLWVPVLDESGGFELDYPVTFGGGGTGLLSLRGSIDKTGKTSGTFTWTESFTDGGTAYSCSSGTVTWTGGTGALAPPPLSGPALGHYRGLTAQNNHISFDLVTRDGYLYATNVGIDEVDESCRPDANGTVTDYSFGPYGFFVTAGGHMRYAYHSSDGATTFVLELTIGAGTATGTIDDSRVIEGSEGSYACASGVVPFTATLG